MSLILSNHVSKTKRPVPDGIHKALMDLLYRYVIVGGLPAVVNCFLETRNIELIYKEQRSIISEYEDDMVKYADDTDKPHIRECFESIPKQLAKENKKFQYSVVRKGGRASQFTGSLQWLEDAGVVGGAITRRPRNCRWTAIPSKTASRCTPRTSASSQPCSTTAPRRIY